MSFGARINGYFRDRHQRARRPILLLPPPVSRGVMAGSRRIIDPDSGLVSHETTSRELQLSDYHWDFHSEEVLEAQWEEEEEVRANVEGSAAIQPVTRGTPRLMQLAVACTIKNVANISYETVQDMPSIMLEYLWRELSKRRINSFNTWKIFSKVLDRKQGAILDQFRYRKSIAEPVPSLFVYIKPLTSNTFKFLVNLSITTAFSTADLVDLSALANLAALEMVNPQHGDKLRNDGKQFDNSFGDRAIKTWSESAIARNGFQVLRILKLRNFEAITNACFQYLNGFPILAVFEVLDCNFNGLSGSGAEQLGWVVHPDGAILEILQSYCAKHAMALRTTLGLPVQPIRRATAEPLSDKSGITMIPRADLPAILAADRAASTSSNQVYELTQNEGTMLDQTPTGRSRLARIGSIRFDSVNQMSSRRVRELETWEFRVYTALNRISELRGDEDLRIAGLDVGELAPMASNEVISSIPIASIRLGPHLRYTVARGNDSSRHSTRSSVRRSIKGYVYTRISLTILSRVRTRDEADGEANAEDEAGDGSGGSGSRQNKRRKVRGEKRQAIGDLLAGVMGII